MKEHAQLVKLVRYRNMNASSSTANNPKASGSMSTGMSEDMITPARALLLLSQLTPSTKSAGTSGMYTLSCYLANN